VPALQQAYALRDNPFRLDALPSGIPSHLRDGLQVAPLRMALESRLTDYYSDGLYRSLDPTPGLPQSGTPLEDFTSRMGDLGFSQAPKTVASGRSRIFLIRGPMGTGKTTLAHRMVRWLLDCAPPADAWRPFLEWTPGALTDAQQSEFVAKDFRDQITGKGKGRFACLFDDVRMQNEKAIVDLYSSLSNGGYSLYFFLTTSDDTMRKKKTYRTSNPAFIPYDTETLTPEQAIEHCRSRIEALRSPSDLAWLETYPLFPFTEDIIRSGLSPDSRVLWNEAGPLGIREFNTYFTEALDDRRKRLPDDFDIATIPASDIPKYFVDPTSGYREQQVA
jgi:hypothetical protein